MNVEERHRGVGCCGGTASGHVTAPALCLQTCRYVHSVAEEVSSAHHHVADVNPDGGIDTLVGGDICVRLGQLGLS
jgi:hypothetical protein